MTKNDWLDQMEKDPPNGHVAKIMMNAEEELMRRRTQKRREFLTSFFKWSAGAGLASAGVVAVLSFRKDGNRDEYVAESSSFGAPMALDIVESGAESELLADLDLDENFEKLEIDLDIIESGEGIDT
jgi:hypothetical protein